MCASPLEILMLPETPSYVGAVDVAVIKPVRRVAAARRRRRHRCTPPSSPLPHPPPLEIQQRCHRPTTLAIVVVEIQRRRRRQTRKTQRLSPLSSLKFNDAAAAKLERPNDCLHRRLRDSAFPVQKMAAWYQNGWQFSLHS